MAHQVGNIPEFTEDASAPETVQEEVKETVVETPPVQETVTPEPPAEKPADTPSASADTLEPSQPNLVQDPEAQKAIEGLQNERVRLLKEISELKGQRREIKQERLATINQEIEDLKDVHPDDVSLVEKITRAKGIMTRGEVEQMFYNAVKQEEETKFFDRYPEYKVENDPDGKNWSLFESEVARVKDLGWTIPSNPRKIGEAMEFIHKNIVKVSSGPSAPVAAQKRQIEVASHGGGGAQRPSPSAQTLSPERKADLIRGGFSQEDIKNMEARLG